ncbi:hypothetical protein BpHYR1_029846, partial [Brachionus plicatilis]
FVFIREILQSFAIVFMPEFISEYIIKRTQKIKKHNKKSHIIGCAYRLKLMNFDKIGLEIPISNKRKRGAFIKTKSALEFQPSELFSNKENGIESLEEDDVVETTSKRAIMEKTNEIKSSSIQISCEKCNTKIYDLIELIFTGFVDRYYLCSILRASFNGVACVYLFKLIMPLFKTNRRVTTPQEATSSKRSREEDEAPMPIKRQRFQILKHCILNASLTSEDTVLELFENVRIIGVDKEGFTGKKHYYILGIPKLFKRAARNLSKITLEQMGISHHLARQAFNSMYYGEIKDFNHYENLVNYIQRKKVIYENTNITWVSQGNRVMDTIERMKAPNKFSKDDMAHFRRMYPEPNSWHADVIKLKLTKSYTDQLEQMEAQRCDEDSKKPLIDSDYEKLAPFKAYLEPLRNVRVKVDGHETNSGWCLVICGKAATYKTTANLILAQSYGPYHVWTGHQYIEKDVLKYDDAARAQIEQLVIEEMAWTSLPHKKTLDDTLCSGADLNIRLAKNKSWLEGLKMKIKRFFMSYNPDNIIDFETLNKKINSKMEFKRRFYVLDFDSLEYANLFAKPKGKWTEDLIPNMLIIIYMLMQRTSLL